MKQNTLICQFASPLDVDQHNKPEAVVLEGKYWKRKLQAVTAEYKKWRMYYRNQVLGCTPKDMSEMLMDGDSLSWNTQSNDALHMMVDEDYMNFMSDTLFSTITNQPFVFPDSREIAKAGLADFIQPSLGPLQPNLDDIMDLEPLTDLINTKLPPVPEEQASDALTYKSMNWDYHDTDFQVMPAPAPMIGPIFPTVESNESKLQQFNDEFILGFPTNTACIQPQSQQPQQSTMPFQTTVILKNNVKPHKNVTQQHIKLTSNQEAQGNLYANYQTISDLNTAKNIQTIQNIATTSQGEKRSFKFNPPMQPNYKFTNQITSSDFIVTDRQPQLIHTIGTEQVRIQKDASTKKNESGVIPRPNNVQRRPRSRSTTREPQQRPPLISAVSDPAIMNTNSSSMLLTHLLTSNNHRRKSNPVSLDNPTVLVKREEVTHNLSILASPQSQIIIPTPSTSSDNQIILNSLSTSNSPLDHNSRGLDSPESPTGPSFSSGITNSPGRSCDSTSPHRDRRVGHIHAEQKRRYNIKNGFDMIHSLIPHLNQNPNTKLSKAAMLQKGADYIRQLRSERNQLKEEMDTLRQQIECLNTSISNCQSMLPATGAPVSRRRDSKMQEMFEEYVRARTLENWKFWIFGFMMKPLLESYNNFVSTSSLDDLYRSTMLWVEQHCTLSDLRPIVLTSLRHLCTTTDILADPEKLPEEARAAVMPPKSIYP